MKALGRLVAAGGSVALLLSGMVATSAEAAGNLTAAPYYVPLDNDPQDIGDAITASGQKSFILAFVLAPNGGGCTPTWDGNAQQPVSGDTAVAAKVSTGSNPFGRTSG